MTQVDKCLENEKYFGKISLIKTTLARSGNCMPMQIINNQ